MLKEGLTDSHAHLNMEPFSQDLDQVINRAREAGLRNILNIALGPEIENLNQAFDFVQRQEGIYLAVGVHPHDSHKMNDETVSVLQSFSGRKKVVAIGEIGLDYYYEHCPREIQRERFGQLLDLALTVTLPVCIHSRDAFEDTYHAIGERNIFKRIGGVLHCFTGTKEEAQKYLELGAYISFSGIVTFKKAHTVQEAAKTVPIEKMLIETDSPFLAPVPFRGKRNEPSYIVKVAEAIAELKGLSVNDVARITSHNAQELFQILKT